MTTKEAFTLTARQLRNALDFVAPDFDKEEDQRDTEVTIGWAEDGVTKDDEGNGDPAGYRCWLADYPEEGCIPLLDEYPSSSAGLSESSRAKGATPEAAEPAGTASARGEEIARLKAQVEELQAEVDDLNVNDERDVWPGWAEAILETVREYSGYDGYDDQDGIDLPSEVAECLAVLNAIAERASMARAVEAIAAIDSLAAYGSVGPLPDHPWMPTVVQSPRPGWDQVAADADALRLPPGWVVDTFEVRETGVVELGTRNEDGVFCGFIAIDTDNYFQPEAAERIARVIIGALERPAPAQAVNQPTTAPEQCKGDPGECAFNGGCMYACAPGAQPDEAPDRAVKDALTGAQPDEAQERAETKGWLSAVSCSRVADLLHLLKYATITTPSPGDAGLAARIMASLRTDGAAKCELASYVALRAQADEDAARWLWWKPWIERRMGDLAPYEAQRIAARARQGGRAP